MIDINALQKDIATWSNSAFGGGDRFFGIMSHLKEEVVELEESDGELEEFADCLMLIVDAASQRGIDAESLLFAMKAKLGVNKRRAWGKPDETGKVNHIRSDDELNDINED